MSVLHETIFLSHFSQFQPYSFICLLIYIFIIYYILYIIYIIYYIYYIYYIYIYTALKRAVHALFYLTPTRRRRGLFVTIAFEAYAHADQLRARLDTSLLCDFHVLDSVNLRAALRSARQITVFKARSNCKTGPIQPF